MAREALPDGTLVGGEYRIDGMLGGGGFGVTYRGTDISLNRSVAIKEYFPYEFAVREGSVSVRSVPTKGGDLFTWGRSRFLQEAQTLAQFSHPNIVRVSRILEENNTAYMVLDFEEGLSVNAWLESLARPPTQEELDRLLPPLLEALAHVHDKGYLHRDIAPDNIIVRKNGTPVLIDFGSARRDLGERTRMMSAVVKSGYSPPEQYTREGKGQGPWSDIYALAATLYRAVAGDAPLDAPERSIDEAYVPLAERGLAGYRSGFLSAIDAALALRPRERPQSIAAWRGMLLTDTPWPSGRSAPPTPERATILRPDRALPPSSPSAPPAGAPGRGSAPKPPRPPQPANASPRSGAGLSPSSPSSARSLPPRSAPAPAQWARPGPDKWSPSPPPEPTPPWPRSPGEGGPSSVMLLALAVAFAAFVALLVVLEQSGLPNRVLAWMAFLIPLGLYVVLGLLSYARSASGVLLAGRSVSPFANGLATASAWMSVASFVGLSGTLYLLGYDGLTFVLGWTGGFVLMGFLLAPALRRQRCATLGDFLALRFGDGAPRVLCALVIVAVTLVYIAAQLVGFALVARRALDIPWGGAVLICVVVLLAQTLPGGARSGTWTQAVQCIILLACFLTPLAIMTAKKYGIPLPWLVYGKAVQEIAALEQSMLTKGLASSTSLKPHAAAHGFYDRLNFFALIFSLMLGTAVMPHVLPRFLTVSTPGGARRSVAWTLLLVVALYAAAPAYAAFSKLETYTMIERGTRIADLPGWIFTYTRNGLVRVCGAAPETSAAALVACNRISGHPGTLRHQDIVINGDAIVLAAPEVFGMPFALVMLILIGAVAATLSTASGLIIATGITIGRDLYGKALDPRAGEGDQVVATRLGILIATLASTALAGLALGPGVTAILIMVAWTFSLAASALFVPLVLGVWWRRATRAGCIAGMLAGLVVCLIYLVGTSHLGMPRWFGINTIAAAVFGVPASFLAMLMVSLASGGGGQHPVQPAVSASPAAGRGT